MPAILVSCYDGYAHLWPGFRYYLKKYMEFNAPVVLASVKGNASDGDPFFCDIATGQGEWSDRLICAIDGMEPSWRVFLMLEDYWISKPWTQETWDRMCATRGDAVRWDQHAPLYKFVGNSNRYAQNSPYTASLRPTMWKIELLKRVLTPGETAFETERFGSKRINKGPPHHISLEMWDGYENVHKMERIKGRIQSWGYMTEKGKEMQSQIPTQ